MQSQKSRTQLIFKAFLCNFKCIQYLCLTLSERTRDRFVNLVSEAYSSISLVEFSNFVGLSELEAGELASKQPGWTIDTQNKIIIPVRNEVKETETIPSEQQLHLLTDFVAFLEK